MPKSPDFDRLIGQLDGLPEVVKTKPTTIRSVGMLGIGAAQVSIVQTYRQRDVGDWIFFQQIADGVTVEVAIPPEVSACIARQRDALTTKNRKKAAKASAQDRMDRGEQPAFLRRAK